MTGLFSGTVDFDPGPGVDDHTSSISTQADAFLSKFDPDGNFIWARTWGGTDNDKGFSLVIDSANHIYVTGFISNSKGGPTDLDPGPGEDLHTVNGYEDAFLSKFDSDGNYIWGRNWGSANGHSVSIDGLGDEYVTGFFQGTVDFDPGPGSDEHSSGGDGTSSCFLSKFDQSGNFIWARTWGEPKWTSGKSVASDKFGNAYTAGQFDGTVDFDPGPGVDNHTTNGSSYNFLSKLDSDGNFAWARTWGQSIEMENKDIPSVAIDASGDAYVAGAFEGTVDFDPGPGDDSHTAIGSDAFLSKFDSNGNFIWADVWGGNSWDYAQSIAMGNSGDLYVTGEYSDSVDFDPGAGTDIHLGIGAFDIFLSKFDLDGNFTWARTWGAPENYDYSDWAYSVGVDNLDNPFVTGFFRFPTDFDPGPGIDTLTAQGIGGVFLSKFPPDGNW